MANIVNYKKLLHSKWTSRTPKDREKHHMVVQVIFKDPLDPLPEAILMEAVINHRQWRMHWEELKNSDLWSPGWQS